MIVQLVTWIDKDVKKGICLNRDVMEWAASLNEKGGRYPVKTRIPR